MSSSLRSSLVIYLAAIANCIVVLATIHVWGWSFAGLHAAARNSARFSAIWFVVVFAAPGLARIAHRLSNGVTLLWSWFATHLIHFATVAILLASFDRRQIVQHPGQTLAVLLIGSSIVVGAAVTSASRSRLQRTIHSILLYAVFGIFTLAFTHNRVVRLRALAIALIVALVVRLTAHLKSTQHETATLRTPR
jgi:hypothetical protein